ncbi:MAG: protein kinase, partial [Pseudomonadota bacterium]
MGSSRIAPIRFGEGWGVMAITAQCPQCGAVYSKVKAEQVGKTARCKKCGTRFQVRDCGDPGVRRQTVTASGNEVTPPSTLALTKTVETGPPPEPRVHQPTIRVESSPILPETVYTTPFTFTEGAGQEAHGSAPISLTVPVIAPAEEMPQTIPRGAARLPEVGDVDSPVGYQGRPAPPNERAAPSDRNPRPMAVAETQPGQKEAQGPRFLQAGVTVPGEIGRTLYLGQKVDAEELKDAEKEVGLDWRVGEVVLGLYEVVGLLGEGGMAKVYRVLHRGWNTYLAVKNPKAQIVSTPRGRSDFTQEAETWVNLGVHPYVVTCYYVRTLGGIPRVFCECVEGGSLSDWIRGGGLYRGDDETVTIRILDMAIQMAWGLHYAHERGLIHRDVKPANVMVTSQGIAKIGDFGL